MEFWKTNLCDWDIGWSVAQIEHNNWVVMYNGHPVQSEFTSKRDALDKASVWEVEMEQEWGIQPLKEKDKFYAK
jgi:hypothetical protein